MSIVAEQIRYEEGRRVGRTTQSLRHALNLAAEGRKVSYVTHTTDAATVLRQFIMGDESFADIRAKIALHCKNEIRFEGGGVVRFFSFMQDRQGRMRGYTTAVIPDHYAYEQAVEALRAQDARVVRLEGQLHAQDGRLDESLSQNLRLMDRIRDLERSLAQATDGSEDERVRTAYLKLSETRNALKESEETMSLLRDLLGRSQG